MPLKFTNSGNAGPQWSSMKVNTATTRNLEEGLCFHFFMEDSVDFMGNIVLNTKQAEALVEHIEKWLHPNKPPSLLEEGTVVGILD